MNVSDTLKSRKDTHGRFIDVAKISQSIKTIITEAPNKHCFTNVQIEAIDMIASKLARIACGNPSEADHWHDIAGYATLVEKYLKEQ